MTAKRQGFGGFPKVFANFAFDLVRMLNDVIQVVPGLQPFNGGFRAAFVDPGNVVHLVAHQRQVVHDLIRANTEFLDHAVAVHAGIRHGVDQGDMIAHQLRHVLVAGRYHHINTLAGGFVGERPDDIVGLHATDNQQRQPHGPNHVMDWLDLHGQIVRHRRAGGLVVFVQIVAEGLALGVKHHHHFRAWKILFQFPDHTDNTLYGARGVALAGHQWRQGMISAEEVGRTIYENHRRSLLLCHIKTDPDSD